MRREVLLCICVCVGRRESSLQSWLIKRPFELEGGDGGVSEGCGPLGVALQDGRGGGEGERRLRIGTEKNK